ncbi:hypothetical protein G7Y79_00016g041260 [Physcia stellaris]|nr:hypothetical protein G7Y79_00016g041260 [Physcia stellaris]
MASLPPSEIAYQQAHIDDNLSTTLIAVSTIFCGVALLSLVVRLIARRLARASFGWDDYLAIATMVPLIGLNIAVCLLGHWGIGRVLLWVMQHPQNRAHLGKTVIAVSLCYDSTMTLGKLSFLALLARIFTLHRTWFRIVIYFWGTYTLLWWMSGWLIIFLSCDPLSTNWGIPRHCEPGFFALVSVAVTNAISDVGILALPQPLIWQLQLPLGKKIGLSMLFLVGTFASAISITRIILVRRATLTASLNPTYNIFTSLFTVLEPASFVICANLPMAYSFFKRLPESKLVSYFSSLIAHLTGPRSIPSADGSAAQLPVLGNKVKPKYWNKLDDSLFDSQAGDGRQFSRKGVERGETLQSELVASHGEGVSTKREYWELAVV